MASCVTKRSHNDWLDSLIVGDMIEIGPIIAKIVDINISDQKFAVKVVTDDKRPAFVQRIIRSLKIDGLEVSNEILI